MNRINKGQKEKVGTFAGITGANNAIAIQCLQAAGWAVDAAIDNFYSDPTLLAAAQASSSKAASANKTALTKLYNRYRDKEHDLIRGEGVGQFCEDLQVDPSDVVMLVISWHFKAEYMCEYTKEEFIDGMAALGCDTAAQLRRKLPELRRELNNERVFKEVYAFAYPFLREKGQKCVHQEIALAMWQLLFADGRWPMVNAWCNFLQRRHNKAISRDTWMQLLDFSRGVRSVDDLADFSDGAANSAWPVLIDEFVEEKLQEAGMDTS